MKLNKVLMLVAVFSLVTPSISLQANVQAKAAALKEKAQKNPGRTTGIVIGTAVGVVAVGLIASIVARSIKYKVQASSAGKEAGVKDSATAGFWNTFVHPFTKAKQVNP